MLVYVLFQFMVSLLLPCSQIKVLKSLHDDDIRTEENVEIPYPLLSYNNGP